MSDAQQFADESVNTGARHRPLPASPRAHAEVRSAEDRTQNRPFMGISSSTAKSSASDFWWGFVPAICMNSDLAGEAVKLGHHYRI
ncbi:unnamed protein product [Heligmosomoides polygyrus]|uniref:Uncharacterized protein n=1 Tax=Heligmosomoides polygyrus TaxID=6339 RepID=A0A183G9J5_HELPZ|nr:unnamed protein product [Heligmosomoides polygyrus]